MNMESEPQIITYAIDVPPCRDKVLVPDNNWIGALLLQDCLSKALQLAGVYHANCGVNGELNHCAGLFEVTNLATGLTILRTEIESRCLLAVAQIGWFDRREIVWRKSYPTEPIGAPWDLQLGKIVSETRSRMAELRAEMHRCDCSECQAPR